VAQPFSRGFSIANNRNEMPTDIKTTRPFQERFLDGYGRSELRTEVEKVKPKRFKKLRKKYATWALGASLAFGGVGVPMKMIQDSHSNAAKGAAAETAPPPATAPPADAAIQHDVQQAKDIASQVAGGVQAVAGGVQLAASDIAKAPQQISMMTDQVKEHFFKTQVPFGSIIYSEAKKNNISPELV